MASTADAGTLETRLTRRFALEVPLVLAPMALASGGALASAWARGGGLGLVGGGYGDLGWTQREYGRAIANLRGAPHLLRRLGCGFITWALDRDARAFDWLLEQEALPAAVMLSFGDPTPWVRRLADKRIPAICQIQRFDQLEQAVDAGAAVIAVQGNEAGGHGLAASHARGTMAFVPEVADRLAAIAPDTVLLAAGGIADGRGLAAALMLGADGALIGTRAWATRESLASDKAVAVALGASGDDTMRTGIFDVLRQKDWPDAYAFRAYRNRLHRAWEGREEALAAAPAEAIAAYRDGVAKEDYDYAHVTVGEGVGLIHGALSAEEMPRRIAAEAVARLDRGR